MYLRRFWKKKKKSKSLIKMLIYDFKWHLKSVPPSFYLLVTSRDLILTSGYFSLLTRYLWLLLITSCDFSLLTSCTFKHERIHGIKPSTNLQLKNLIKINRCTIELETTKSGLKKRCSYQLGSILNEFFSIWATLI